MMSLSHSDRMELSFDLPPARENLRQAGRRDRAALTEAMTNAFKYSRPSGARGKLRLTARRGRDGGLVMEIADDGVGCRKTSIRRAANPTASH